MTNEEVLNHPLMTLSLQEIFNLAVKGMASQDWVQSGEKELDDEGNELEFICAYDGPNDTHCAIGWVCAKTQSVHPPEGDSIDGTLLFRDLTQEQKEHIYKLGDLQRVHDHFETKAGMIQGFIDYAAKNSLELPQVLLEN